MPEVRPLLLSLVAASLLQGAAPPSQPSPQASPPGAPVAPLGAPAGAVTQPGGGLITIESDSQSADNLTGIVTALGNVRITYPDRRMVATARQAQYYSREGRLILSGDVDVVDADGQRIRAERLIYRVDAERLVAEPARGQQVFSRLRLQMGGKATSKPPMP